MNTPFIQDDQIELDALKRRQALADSLRQQAGQSPQGQMVSGRYVAPGFMQQAQPLLAALASRYSQGKIDTDTKAFTDRLNTQNQNDMSGFVEALRGKPAETFKPTVPNDDEGNAMPTAQSAAVAPDRNKALSIALRSKNPMLQSAGGSIIKNMMAEPKWEKAELPNADGSKRVGYVNVNAPNPVETFIAGGTAPVKNEYVNGQGVNPFTNQTNGTAIPKQLEPDSVVTQGPNGTLVPNMPVVNAKGAIAAAGRPSVTSTVINAGPKAFETELGKLDAEQLGKWRTAAEAANNTVGVVQSMRNAEKAGAYSGAGADAKLTGARVISTLTGVTPKGMVGSEMYNAESKKLVLEHIKTLGTNPSNADREFIEKTVPQLATSAAARAAMANFMEQKAKVQIDLYQRADSHARSNHGLGGFQSITHPVASNPATEKTVVRTGTLNGRKVIQYSDGSTSYAN